MKQLFLIPLLIFAVVAQARADDATTFAKANAEYAAGHFTEAIASYEHLAQTGKWSATLAYDLGNAYFRSGDAGKAILNYQRALALEPKHPEALANLRLVRDQARALELPQTEVARALRFAAVSQYAIGAAIGFWLAAFAGVAWFFRGSRRRIALAVLASGLLFGAACATAIWLSEHGNSGSGLAIVTAKNIEARLATADNSSTVLALPPGSEVKILSTRGDWVYAALPNDLRGWIPARAAELVRL